jgi:hypothetical protein
MKTKHFLLVYDPAKGKLIDLTEYANSRTALHAYEQAEERNRHEQKDYEIVLVGADSLDTVKATHGHYFRESAKNRKDSTLFSKFLSVA